jgi:hypothetical protein
VKQGKPNLQRGRERDVWRGGRGGSSRAGYPETRTTGLRPWGSKGRKEEGERPAGLEESAAGIDDAEAEAEATAAMVMGFGAVCV